MFSLKLHHKPLIVNDFVVPTPYDIATSKLGRRVAYVNRDGKRAEGVIEGYAFDGAGLLSYYVRNDGGLLDSVSSWNFRGQVA